MVVTLCPYTCILMTAFNYKHLTRFTSFINFGFSTRNMHYVQGDPIYVYSEIISEIIRDILINKVWSKDLRKSLEKN